MVYTFLTKAARISGALSETETPYCRTSQIAAAETLTIPSHLKIIWQITTIGHISAVNFHY